MSEVPTTSFTLLQHPPHLLAEQVGPARIVIKHRANHTTSALKQRIGAVEYRSSGPTALSFVGRV
jgi:hypothetical protein